VVAWGDYEGGQTTVSPGFESSMRAIDAGGWHSLALTELTDYGPVVAWGENPHAQGRVEYYETNAPASAQSGVKAIARR
jgi:hypothetical protein